MNVVLHSNTGRQKKSLPANIQGDSYSFDIAESFYGKKIYLSPPILKGEMINEKPTFVTNNILANPSLSYSIFTDIFIKPSLICIGGK